MASPHEIPSICPNCAEGCGFYTILERGKVLTIDYMKNHPVNQGGLCIKGNAVVDIIDHTHRIDSPLLKKDDSTHDKIPWQEAINLIATQLKGIQRKYGTHALAFLTSAHSTNEESYLLQKFARVLGTNNIDCTSFYEDALGSNDLITSLGYASATNPFSDLSNAKCILISGSNFFENHPVIAYWVFEAKARGAVIIYSDHQIPPALLAVDHFLHINPGTQEALIEGMMLHIIEKNLFNQQFITTRTSGFEALQKTLRKQSLAQLEKISGVSAGNIKEAAECYATSSASAIIHSSEFNSTPHSSTISSLVNLTLLCGHVGRPGTGLMPLAEHHNTQGCYDMGTSPVLLPGQVGIHDDTTQQGIAKLWKVKKLPSQKGISFPEMAKALQRGKIKALYIVESDPLGEHINAPLFKQALKNVELLVVQDLVLTPTARQAHLVLPAQGWAEKTGTYTNAERRVQWQSKVLTSPHQIVPSWQLLCSVARKLGFKKQFSFRSPEMILKEINKIIPTYTGISSHRVHHIDGLTWPCPTPKHPGTPILYTEHFATPDGLGKFTAILPKKRDKQTKKYPFYLTFGRSLVSYDVLHSRPSDELLIEINPKDAKKMHLRDQSEVKISTKLGTIKATACVSEKVLPGIVFIPFLPSRGTDHHAFSTIDPRVKSPELNTTTCQVKASGGKQ